MTDPVSAGLAVAGQALSLGTAVAHALDRPDDVDRAAYVGIARGHLARCVEGYRRAKHPGRRRHFAVVGARWAGALREYEAQNGRASTVPVLPWE